ncbi:MAG: transporter [Bacteroidota bacterium]
MRLLFNLFLSLFVLGLLPIMGCSQFSESIASDRPGQAIGSSSVGKGVFQLQSGYNFNWQHEDASSSRFTSHTTDLRLGMSDKFEVNGTLGWVSGQLETDTTQLQVGGLRQTDVGLRAQLLENDGWIPSLGIQGRILLNGPRPLLLPDELGAQLILSSSHGLNHNFSINTNWIIGWYGLSESPQASYVLNIGYGINDRWAAFVEMYGGLSTFGTLFDGGLSFLIDENFQLDFSAGKQAGETTSSWFLDGGLSWRLVKR